MYKRNSKFSQNNKSGQTIMEEMTEQGITEVENNLPEVTPEYLKKNRGKDRTYKNKIPRFQV